MVTSPTGKGVIAMGGITESDENSKEMFELSQSMEWTRLEQTLQIGHWAPLAIPIPDELVHEKIELKNKQRKLKIISPLLLASKTAPMSSNLDSKMKNLNELFPEVDAEIIVSVLENNDCNMEKTVDQLISLFR